MGLQASLVTLGLLGPLVQRAPQGCLALAGNRESEALEAQRGNRGSLGMSLETGDQGFLGEKGILDLQVPLDLVALWGTQVPVVHQGFLAQL